MKNDIITAALNNDISKISEYKSTINYLSGGMEDSGVNEVNELIVQKASMEAHLSG